VSTKANADDFTYQFQDIFNSINDDSDEDTEISAAAEAFAKKGVKVLGYEKPTKPSSSKAQKKKIEELLNDEDEDDDDLYGKSNDIAPVTAKKRK
jgi:hypothetical protein